MQRSRYSQLLTHYPSAVLAVIMVVVCSCTLLNIFVGKSPDFSDPLEGFIPRYSAIHSSYYAWCNLIEQTTIGSRPSKLLTTYPLQSQPTSNLHSSTAMASTSMSSNNSSVVTGDLSKGGGDTADLMPTSTVVYFNSWPAVQPINYTDKELFFCDSHPRDGYAQVASSLPFNLSLLDNTTFHSLCHLQSTIESLSSYTAVCEPGCFCRSFSLVNYMTYLAGMESCESMSASNISYVLEMLLDCQQYYVKLSPDCWGGSGLGSDCLISPTCADTSIYEIFYYILSKDSKLTLSYLHMAKGLSVYPLYQQVVELINDLKHEPVKPIALDFGLKEHVFEESLLTDSLWILLALFIIIIILWLYTESIFITCTTIVSMLFTLILSLSIYQFIFQIDYFPFLNLLAAVVVVGIGADDLFIYWKTWLAIKLARNASILERIVTSTFRHASAAMFVTSASTATAFYACAYTDVVSLRCFTIYAGTCVIVHYLLAISWLPACVLLYEKYTLSWCPTSAHRSAICRYVHRMHSYITTASKVFLKKQSQISTLALLWLPLFTLASAGASVALFYWPKLSPPSSDMFQVLSARHPFEVFDMEVKNLFEVTSDRGYLPIIFVFGVDQKYTGQYFNIASKGSLNLRPLPDLASENAQLWFSSFCYELRQQPFFDSSHHQPIGCFIEELRASLRFKSCSVDPVCCQQLTFPYNRSVFVHCLRKWSTDNKNVKLSVFDAGVRYRGAYPASIVIKFWSNVQFGYNYKVMNDFHSNVSAFLEERTSACTTDKCHAFTPFFTTSGGLLFYDVQNVLVSSLPTTLLVVVVAASLIIFLTTLNVLLTISAIISISCSILNTLALLALLGWQLNILESVIVSLAVGLSMDFPLHVAVAYRIASSTRDRKSRARLSVGHVGGSLTAAMASTLVAGLCMLPTQVLAYSKLGTFLASVAIVSWLHAMFFMPSLLTCIGPAGSFLQLSLRNRRKTKTRRHLEKALYSDEASSEVTQAVSSVASRNLLQTADEETFGDTGLSALDSAAPFVPLLLPDDISLQSSNFSTGTGQRCDRLSPIAELHHESSSNCPSSAESL